MDAVDVVVVLNIKRCLEAGTGFRCRHMLGLAGIMGNVTISGERQGWGPDGCCCYAH
jgi:hypothetical protein